MANRNKGAHWYIIIVFKKKSKLQQLYHEERKKSLQLEQMEMTALCPFLF